MYNKFLEKYLDNDPQKVLSKKGIKIRKVISPLLRFVVRFIAPNSKLKVLRRADIPKQPVVFAATPNEAFAFMDKLIPGKENAFLFRNNLYIRRDDL